ncbi:MAG: Gldg family protein [Deltaproteobacteria bacterium]|nr:Gldg family protein [Deltaproteobacteria bacterium]
MTQVMSIARKELRGFFLSPVALIFLGTFLFVVLFSFFWGEAFFRRNIADVRPLFDWLPLLLIFLVGSLTMRLWSEEQRAGTLEILLTMPIRLRHLVVGKFLGGLALIAVALVLTFALPLTVTSLGELDWGPVFGGYLGALLLAGAYLSIGLCISSATENPLVALLLTCLGCGLLYLVGSEPVVSLFGTQGGELLRAIGSGSRFESIQRGVLDLRDLVYYGSLCVGFLYLNMVILESKRWGVGQVAAKSRSAMRLSVVLVLANLLLLNLGLAGVAGARIDMTERNEYSISPATKKILAGLEAPLLIRGYFSAKTHAKLAPLVPRIRDMLEEYQAVGGKSVRSEFIDPQKSPELEKEASEVYGINSIPLEFADRHSEGVVNSYFTILVKYGDKFEKLGFQDLIEVRRSAQDIKVRLRNLEYDLTRTIKKVVYGFQPLEAMFARATDKIKLTAYITPSTLPKQYADVPARVKKVAEEIAARSGGKFVFETIDPMASKDSGLPKKLYEKFGFKPLAVSLFSENSFYMHLLLNSGDRYDRLYPEGKMTELDIRNELTAGIKRLLPGFLKTVGLMAPKPPPRRQQMMMGRQMPPPPPDRYRMLRATLSENYTLREVELKEGRVPGDVDVLVVMAPDSLDDKQQFAIDQFLMRGGAVVVAAGRYKLELSRFAGGGLKVNKLSNNLDKLLKAWGVEVSENLVLDARNAPMLIPFERNVMGSTIREMRLLQAYPFWIDVRSDGLAEDSPVVAGLPSVVLQWASALTLNFPKDKDTSLVHATPLLKSSALSWEQSASDVNPDFARFPRRGFEYPQGGSGDKENKQRILAVAAIGSFSSAFKGKPSPLFNEGATGDAKGKPKRSDGRTLEQSPKGARLVVIGSADFADDIALSIARQTGTSSFRSNLQLLQNIIDWSVADEDLLSIRSRGHYARTLRPMEESARLNYEMFNYLFVVLALGAIFGVAFVRRRNLQPIELSGVEKNDDKA